MRPVIPGGAASRDSDENPQVPDGALKRFLLMLSDRIFDSRVDRAIPSLAAAPDGPNIRPWDSRRASSIISFSVAATFSERKGLSPDLVSSGRWDSQLSSTVKSLFRTRLAIVR